MTIATTAAFIIVCFMFFAILVRLAHLIWVAIVDQPDRMDYGRNYWDEPEKFYSLEHYGPTAIEIVDREEAYEQG